MPYKRICISSGHGKYVQGAVGPSPWGLNEVNEARRVVDQLASVLTASGVTVMKFADDVSKNQSDNLTRIVDWHNSQTRDLDISVHFNAFEPTPSGRGTEVLYKTQADLAGEMSAAIAAAGFIDRGAKKRDDLKFLNSTEMPAILIETCFVDSEADVRIYKEMFEEICDAIAWVLCDAAPGTTPPPVEPVEPGDKPIITISIDAPDGVDIAVRINGVDVLLGDE
jgi:N-acetylmuramoyl-L-alanine amidase